jgi:dCTP deaminase
MSIKNDAWIKTAAANGMITPFHPHLVRRIDYDQIDSLSSKKVISYGLSSYGYDLRLSEAEFKIFRNPTPNFEINPKRFDLSILTTAPLQTDEDGQYFVLPPHSYALGFTVEHLKIPKNITALFIGKSTYARCGIFTNMTPGESGWEGHLTLELSNLSDSNCRVYANEGIVQALFFEGEPCEAPYCADRKYQHQVAGIVAARV